MNALQLLLVNAGPACFGGTSIGGWTTALSVTVPLALSLLAYGIGVGRLWRAAGVGRGARMWQVASFVAGWLLVVLALVSPLHELSENLFSAHMVEHELLLVLAAPLLVAARPLGPMVWALPRRWRRPVSRGVQIAAYLLGWDILTMPLVAAGLHAAVIWLWHIPVVFQVALRVEWVHWLEHLSFLVSAMFFWWVVVEAARRNGHGVAIFLLFVTAMHSSFLGILIALSPNLIYPIQTQVAGRYGLTPMLDQQLAGLIMWVPPGIVYAGAALVLAGLWIARSGKGVAPPHLGARDAA